MGWSDGLEERIDRLDAKLEVLAKLMTKQGRLLLGKRVKVEVSGVRLEGVITGVTSYEYLEVTFDPPVRVYKHKPPIGMEIFNILEILEGLADPLE